MWDCDTCGARQEKESWHIRFLELVIFVKFWTKDLVVGRRFYLLSLEALYVFGQKLELVYAIQ
jgi:hypothetical protein